MHCLVFYRQSTSARMFPMSARSGASTVWDDAFSSIGLDHTMGKDHSTIYPTHLHPRSSLGAVSSLYVLLFAALSSLLSPFLDCCICMICTNIHPSRHSAKLSKRTDMHHQQRATSLALNGIWNRRGYTHTLSGHGKQNNYFCTYLRKYSFFFGSVHDMEHGIC